MGGNCKFTKDGVEYSADRIPMNLGVQNIRNVVLRTLNTLNVMFYEEYNKELFPGKVYFNGSAQYIMDEKYSEEDLSFKEDIGDIDVIVDKNYKLLLYELLSKLEGKSISVGVKYLGTNKPTESSIGETIICLFETTINKRTYNFQYDFELLEYENNKPTEWSMFSHNSNIQDAKLGIKAVFHKYLIQAIIGANSIMYDAIVCTPTATSENWEKKLVKGKKALSLPRMKKFSVSRGVGTAYQLISYTSDGKCVYRELKPSERKYNTELEVIFYEAFGEYPFEQDIEKFKSFIGVTELMNMLLDIDVIKLSLDRFLWKLFGTREQELDPDWETDLEIKIKAFDTLVEILEIEYEIPENLISEYYRNFKRF